MLPLSRNSHRFLRIGKAQLSVPRSKEAKMALLANVLDRRRNRCGDLIQYKMCFYKSFNTPSWLASFT